MSQYQDFVSAKACQLGDDQAFACTGRQHNNRRFIGFSEMPQGGIDSFLLVWPQLERSVHLEGLNHSVGTEFSAAEQSAPLYSAATLPAETQNPATQLQKDRKSTRL